MTRTVGPSLTADAPRAVEMTPSMPLAPRLAEYDTAWCAGGKKRIEVAHGHRVASEERGSRR